MTKSMMHEKGLPKIFWAEAVYTAVYLSNRCPTTAIPNKTPFEAWSGRRPSVNHLKVFGSICYSQIPKEKRSKLDESSERCIFVGYSTMSKGYRLFNLQLGQVIISRDVQVDENALWNWEENKVEKKDILISTDKEDEIEPSTPDSSSSQPNDESSTDPTSSNSSSPSTTPKSAVTLLFLSSPDRRCSLQSLQLPAIACAFPSSPSKPPASSPLPHRKPPVADAPLPIARCSPPPHHRRHPTDEDASVVAARQRGSFCCRRRPPAARRRGCCLRCSSWV
ncbi:hypothetical protein ZIOFF_034254 [Zingiber officinale]|uniref:Retroviral polymerase SH3-like domain-containing protein n=1 Tax=Zingiber officinale TaxID=94328 RepID=A0A8J5GKU4_ZINOF|nr:hypothetical protein ZIOFF_034254 [Zingiber officinale]